MKESAIEFVGDDGRVIRLTTEEAKSLYAALHKRFAYKITNPPSFPFALQPVQIVPQPAVMTKEPTWPIKPDVWCGLNAVNLTGCAVGHVPGQGYTLSTGDTNVGIR